MSTAVFFSFPGTRRRMYAGPLGPHVDEFVAWLQQQHYKQHSIRCKIRVVADFSRWLGRHSLGAASAVDEQVQRFLDHRVRTSRSEMGDLSALRLQDFPVEDHPISPVEDHLTGSLAEPKATSLTLPFSGWQVCEL